MPNHSLRWRRLLPLTLGSLAIVSLVLLDGGFLSAQAKKAAKDNVEKSEDEPKEEKKVDVKYEPKIPPIIDRMSGSQGIAQVNKINELIKQNWINNKVNPSERCTDYEFIRRASLDIIGRIATEKEITAYMAQPAQTRRSWLIDQLLKNPEFGENLANVWTVMLLTRSGSQKMYQEQMRDWLTEKFNDKDADWSKITTEILTATGKSNDNAAVNFIAHHIGDEIRMDQSKKGAATPQELRESGRWDMVPVTSRTTKLFLGLRTQCVQCHDHPFNGEWGQHHFWGINAFFRPTTVSQRPGMMMQKKVKGLAPPQVELRDESQFNEKGIVSYERRSAVVLYTGMMFLDGKRVKTSDIPAGSTRRQKLAQLITSSPYFGKVYVNRTWGQFFGKSFTKDAADDFGDHNPVTNPELLDYLAEEFSKNYNHNPKELIRWICNSQAYGLSSKATKWNDKMDDEVLFARMLLKAMTPEQLFESLMTASASKIAGDKQQKHALREKWLDTLVQNFGNDEGEEGTFTGTVVQALMLMNGADINSAIMDTSVGTVANVNREKGLKINKAAVDKLYLAALNRPCTPQEYAKIADPKTFMFFNPAVKSKVSTSSPAFAAGYYQDLFWALLNSNEFILNH